MLYFFLHMTINAVALKIQVRDVWRNRSSQAENVQSNCIYLCTRFFLKCQVSFHIGANYSNKARFTSFTCQVSSRPGLKQLKNFAIIQQTWFSYL